MNNQHNKKKYKALMLDVDGTLVGNSLSALPSQRVIDAIAKAKEKLYVGIATARNLSQIEHIIAMLGIAGPCVVTGGTQIVDAKTKKILQQQHLLSSDILPILAIAKELGIVPRLVKDKQDISDRYYTGDSLEEILCLFTKPMDAALADMFITQVSHIPTITAHKTGSWEIGKVHVSVNHVAATKQHGIFAVAKILGIETHEIIGVGDSYNDFPLLMACGLKVAMGNAVEDLKAIADYVAPTVEEDGVADVIEKFVL